MDPGPLLPAAVRNKLLPEEEILYVARIGRPSLAEFLPLYALPALSFLGGRFFWTLVLLLAVHGNYLFTQFRRNRTSLIVTDHRVIGTQWIEAKRYVFDLPLSKVESVLVEEVTSGSYGTIRIAGVGRTAVHFEWIEKPGQFRQRFLEEIGKAKEA